ncbi:bifunctional serine/threonine protein kinase/MFS transporter [Chroococcidiopsis sp. CCMEE 29]|uniref:bifunctional serine/threonine protein kinase/MFS transporter n=1 Tax=Chroococcidiopsis sp. CCMEE 29 TaxID=155894 RepID=UPI002021DFA3|nr:bifunctional serine/threonine protein kinase/MFS transporter [Chroococcidiopsis sp. CCMEE 29]
MLQSVSSVVFCINPHDPQHPHSQVRGNKFCTICGSPIALKNRYIPLQILGSGGFAKIYTVWDLATQTERVLKVLVETAPKARELFKQEADILKSLRHPAVPRVEPDGYFQLSLGNPPQRLLPCLVMEKINGQTLEDILESHPQGCPEAWVLNWFNQAVEILRELHKKQIIHRDLKPSNLMLRQETNQLVVIDFGGAKKIRSALFWSKESSTRLYSPGYSPPEQSEGRDVEPAADFYALGRTMIQLLTGKSPPELADSVTGELRWRHLVRVTPGFADLLDELVREDVRQRPTNAARIQKRLAQSPQKQPGRQVSSSQQVTPLTQKSLNWSQRVTSAFTKGFSQSTRFLVKFITQLVRACLDTTKAMVLSAIAVCVGTSVGFVLAYWSPLGSTVDRLLSQQLPFLLQDDTQIALGSEIILFAAAGLATAWGLTVAGSFGQRRRYFVAPLTGFVGYGLGWLVWLAATPYNSFWGMAGLIAGAVTVLTLGLGLRNSYLIHAVFASVGTTILFAILLSFNLFPTPIFHLNPQPGWFEFWVYITFFSFVSLALSFWLGISYYLIVPCLRWLGWR